MALILLRKLSGDVMKSSIHSVVQKMASNVPGAYAYVFDGESDEFIFKSEENELLEETIIKLNKEESLAKLVNKSTDNFIQLDCKDTNRKFLIKKLATNLYLGMCVQQTVEIIEKAKQEMSAPFN